LSVESMPNVGSTFIFTVKNRMLECW